MVSALGFGTEENMAAVRAMKSSLASWHDSTPEYQLNRKQLGAQPAEKPGLAAARPEGRQIAYTDLYEWGLSGRPGSAERKAKLLNALGLPPRLSKKELVEALNRLYTFEQLNELQLKILDS